MKTKLSLLAASGVLALTALACGSSSPNQYESTEPDPGGGAGSDVVGPNGSAGSGGGSTNGGSTGGGSGSGNHAGSGNVGTAGNTGGGGSPGAGGGAGSNGMAGGAGGAGGSGRVVGPSVCPGGSLVLKAGEWTDITPAAIDPAKNASTDLQFDPSNPCTLYALYGGGGLWKSTDAGANWTQIGNIPMPNSLGRVLIDPNNGQHMYLTGSVGGNSLGFWISNDGGKTWAIPDAFKAGGAAGMWTNDVYNMSADPTDFNHVVLTLHYTPGPSAPILETLDGGKSFIVHAADPGMDHAQGLAILYNPALHIGDAKTWLVGAGYGAGIFRTTNAGATWTKVSDAQQNHGGFDVHYSAQGFLHVGVATGLIRSTDNGVTWTKETNGIPYGYYYSVIGDGHQLYTSQAYVGVNYNLPFLTTPEGGANEGQTWTALSTQKLPSGPWKMVFDAGNEIIYNASWGAAWALKVKH